MKRRRWTEAELRILRARYPHERTAALAAELRRQITGVYTKARALGIGKSAAYLASPDARRLRRGDNVGAAHRFKPGRAPWNKGLKGWQPGGRSVATRFRKGNRPKRWDPEIYCIGALRINSGGGLDIKLRDGQRAWCAMARWVWITERGPIPRGMAVCAINGDAHDTRVENLRLATRAELMARNTYHRYPKAIARAIQLRGALNRRIRRLEKEHAEHAG